MSTTTLTLADQGRRPDEAATVITYHRMPSGEWVAHGSASEVQLGPVEIHKRSGSVCHRVVDEIEPAGDGTVYGYLTVHCKPESRAARDARVAAVR